MDILRSDTQTVLTAFKSHVLEDIAKSRGCTLEEAEIILDAFAATYRPKLNISRDQAKELKGAVVGEMGRRVTVIV